MKKILSILLALSLSTSAFADFEGFPCATNNIWQQCRSFGAISQLWYAVAERCMVLTNRYGVYPLNIEESWVVQDGYSNEVVSLTFGTNVVLVTNRYPHFITIPTTNQVCDLTVTISNVPYGGWFVPLSTNNVQPTTNVTLSLPVTHEFISTLDARMFYITPYFVNTNNAWYDGTFNDYFSRWGTATYADYVEGKVPTDWPYHCVASVMKNAGIGYITNLVYNGWYDLVAGSNIIAGNAWFTRQPAVTNAWALWQAVLVGQDAAIVSGMPNATLNGAYIARKYGDDALYGWWPTTTEWKVLTNETMYVKADYSAIISKRGAGGATPPPSSTRPPRNDIWCIDSFSVSNPVSASALSNAWLTMLGGSPGSKIPAVCNIITGSWQSVSNSPTQWAIWQDFTTDLFTSNGWRDITTWGSFPGNFWYKSRRLVIARLNIDDFTNHPPIAGISVVRGSVSNWICRPLANYDVRYYDDQPRPFYRVLINGTNSVNLNINMGGTAFINLSEPDFMGEQVVMYTNEVKTLTASNTPSEYRWFSIESKTNTYVTGEAPIGSVITLMWTNSHTFDHLPYRLEAKDLDERWKYLRELVWTTVPYEWVQTQEAITTGADSTNVEINVVKNDTFYYNGWADEGGWQTYRDTFTTGGRGGWNAGFFTGYPDPKYEIPMYTNFPGMTNFTFYPALANSAPGVVVSAHAIATRESYAMWRTEINFNGVRMLYPCDPGYGYLGWFTIFPEPGRIADKPWLYDMTDSSPGYMPQYYPETGIGYEGPNFPFNCGGAGDNYVGAGAAPGSPSYTLEKDYGYDATAYQSKLCLTNIDCRTPLDASSKVSFDAQVYVGVYSPVVYHPLQMFDSYTNVTTGSVVSLPYEISLAGVTNILTPPPFFAYTGTNNQEQIVWEDAWDGSAAPLFQERSYGVWVNPRSNEVVYTTNDVVIRWLHIPASTNDPYISESNTYYSATNIPPFQWSNVVSNASTRIEYTTNIIVVPYLAVEVQTNHTPGTYPYYWANYPDNIWSGTEYDYGTITTNFTLHQVVTTTSLVWSGYNEWATIATTTNATTNGVSYPGTDGWVHTPTNDILEYGGFYSDYATASNRLVALGLSAYITNLQNRLVCFTQDVVVANFATVTIIETGNRAVVGTRDTWAENCNQLQNFSIDFTATATAPECLIKWNFKRK